MGLYLLNGQNLKSIVFYSAWNDANEYSRMDRQNKRLSIDFWFKIYIIFVTYNIIWDWFLFGLQHNINVHDIPEGVSDLQFDLFYSKKLTFVCQVH